MKASQEKRDKIKQTLFQTRERRKSQICKVYTLKIDKSHLSKQQSKFLYKVFIEAKWFYNYLLNQEDVFNNSHICKDKEIEIKVLDKFEKRTFEYLSSQMKGGLYGRIIDAIKVLSKLKKRNFTIGRLKFKPEINSIELPQYNVTWKFKKTRIHIQGCKTPFKINGLKQIPENCEFANAHLLRKPSGYYLSITTFQSKSEKVKYNKEVGLDFGIKTSITTSDGEKFDIKIPESKKLKRLQLWLSKKTDKKSKNRRQNIKKIKQEYEIISNQKQDQVNKLVSYLMNNYDIIYIQDEMIANWHKGLFGKQVQHSTLGAIKARLKTLESIQVISKFEPTTKLCPSCGALNKISLSERIYTCECGYSKDRDTHSACNILLIGQKLKSNSVMERNSTTSEDQTSGFLKSNRENLSHSPMKMEAPAFRRG
jgi:transposase